MRERHAQHATTSARSAPRERAAIATAAWQAESSPASSSTLRGTRLEDGTPALEWNFSIAADEQTEPYAAMRFPLEAGFAAYDRLQLRARSDRPRRVWAQLRAPGGVAGERWGLTFYVHDSLDPIDLRFAEFRPLGTVSATRPPLDRVDSLLLVIDTLHTTPGAEGRLWITDLWLAR
jgi:hypothetical protein